MSGEKDFAPDGRSTARGDSRSDPKDDMVDWLSEYNRLRRTFHERWDTAGMKQIAAAVYAVAFEGQDPSTIQQDGGDDPERAQVELENEQALLAFGSFIPADNRKYMDIFNMYTLIYHTPSTAAITSFVVPRPSRKPCPSC